MVEYRSGVVVWDHVPASMSHHVDAGRRIGFAVVDALADLHLLDPDEIGLGELGRPVGFVERQVTGWRKRWELVDTGRVPQMSSVGSRLGASMPTVSTRVSVLHNDYKIDNCQFQPADPDRVTSIFDWDMATLGEPLVDLGTLLNYWPDPADRDGERPLHVAGLEHIGLPTRAEVVERYAARTGLDVSGVAWFEAFATWKTCVVLEQLYQRFVRGESTDPRMGGAGRAGCIPRRPSRRAPRPPRPLSRLSIGGSLPLDRVVEVAVPVSPVDRVESVDVVGHRLPRPVRRRRRSPPRRWPRDRHR